MQQQPLHILSQMKVLTSFSVTKKITEKEIYEFYLYHKERGVTDNEIEKLLKDKVFGEIHGALENKTIPGLINPSDLLAPNSSIDKKGMDQLNKYIMSVANKIGDKKYNRFLHCYFINSLIELLELTEHDFERFHKEMNSQYHEEEDDDETEYDEDDEDYDGEYEDDDEDDEGGALS